MLVGRMLVVNDELQHDILRQQRNDAEDKLVSIGPVGAHNTSILRIERVDAMEASMRRNCVLHRGTPKTLVCEYDGVEVWQQFETSGQDMSQPDVACLEVQVGERASQLPQLADGYSM